MLRRFITPIVLMQAAAALSSIAHADNLDRPSAQPLNPPDYPIKDAPEGFKLPPIPEAKNPNSGDRRVFYIKRIIVEGNTLTLPPLTKSYEGRKVTVAELETLRQQLTQYYVDRGYVNSGAVIAADAYRNGDLHITIIEGKIRDVHLKGLERLREGYVKNRLLPDPDKPFNLQTLQERYQLLLSDPLISRMNGQILPGTKPGTGILDVDVKRAKPYQLSLFGNNQRSPSIGAEAFGVNGVVRNLTGLGDTINGTFTMSAGSTRYSGGITLPITDWGTQLFFRADIGGSSVIDSPFTGIGIKSVVHNYEGGISHPFINTLNQHLTMGASFGVRINDTSDVIGPISFVKGISSGHTQASVIRLYQEYTQRWDRHALALRSTFSVGIDTLGATVNAPGQPSSQFFAWLGQGQYAWKVLDNGAQTVLRGNLQLSDASLLPQESIAIGGFNTVRGYRENQLVKDNGYSVSAEFHYPLLGGTDPSASYRVSLVPFMDYGRAWNINTASTSLYSVGMGLEGQIKQFKAALYYGYAINTPLPRTSGNLQDDGIHFTVGMDVL